jgi:hypothetical protein
MTKDEALDKKAKEHMIYRTFEQWKSGNVLEHGVPRTEYYSEDQLDLVEMGWNYGYDAGRAVEQALDKKAENARELGLDYEPADGTQVSKVWWDGEKLMAKPIPLEDFCQPMQDSTCSETLRAQGKAYPRTCRKCGKGPCIGAPKQPPAQPAPVQSCYCPNCEAMGKELAELKAQPAPVQEPVAWMYEVNGAHTILDLFEPPDDAYDEGTLHPLYTTPPAAQRQWVGLTQDEFRDFASTFDYGTGGLIRAIEAKLKEKNT